MATKRKEIKSITYTNPSKSERKSGIISQQEIVHPNVRSSGRISGGMFGPDKELQKDILKSYSQQSNKVLKDPKLNPAGMARVKGEVDSTTTPLTGTNRTTKVSLSYASDTRNAARLRGNKARGTDSSAKRVPVK